MGVKFGFCMVDELAKIGIVSTDAHIFFIVHFRPWGLGFELRCHHCGQIASVKLSCGQGEEHSPESGPRIDLSDRVIRDREARHDGRWFCGEQPLS